jgi:phosphoglycerate dehydrogenase-like enzyme
VVESSPDGTYGEAAMATIRTARVLVVGLDPVGENLFAQAPKVRLVQRLGVGYSNVDLGAAVRHGVTVCNMPDFNAGSVAEHTIMLILALLRRVFDSTLLIKGGQWPLDQMVAAGVYDLMGKQLGLVGYGAIGRAVAARAAAFGVGVCYADPNRAEDDGGIARRVDLDELLRTSDVVSLHLPLTSETRGLIGKRELAIMKRTALVVNTARGALVDEKSLALALEERSIAGAGIDVFTTEPLPPRNALRWCPNILLTPHLAGQTREAMERMVKAMIDNLKRVAEGREPLHQVPMDSEVRMGHEE